MKKFLNIIHRQIKNLKLKIKNSAGGFTLSELLIVIAILGILFTLAGKTYTTERKRVQYNNALADVLTVIKEARNYSVTSRMAYDANRQNNSYTANIDESLLENHRFIPKEGYGVYVEMKYAGSPTAVYDGAEVILFTNVESHDDPSGSNHEMEINQYNKVPTAPGFPDDDLIEQRHILEKKYITLEGLYNTCTPIANQKISCSNSVNSRSIIFRPPLADTYIADNNNPISGKINTLYLVFSNPNAPSGAQKKVIRINAISGFAELLSEGDL